MNNASYNPANTPAWNRLLELASETLSSDQGIAIKQLFQEDNQRFEKYSLKVGELKLDFSKNLVNDDIWEQLINLASQSPLESHREAMYAGEKINNTEDRAVLHAALRSTVSDAKSADESARAKQVERQLQAVERFSEEIRTGSWTGSTGKAITDIINIGIGGSDLGPKMACTALEEYTHEIINLHFI